MSWFQPDDRGAAPSRAGEAATGGLRGCVPGTRRQRRDRGDLAKLLSVRASEVTQRLSGGRNLTLRTLAEMLDVLGYDVHLSLVDRGAGSRLRSPA
jgi:hypothetical protein